MPIQTARQAQEVFKTPQDLTRTGAGRVRREMMDLQRQPDLSKPETGRLKELRRDWNRNLKYTREGMALSGATSPLDAQNRFMRSTEDFRQLNKPAYNRMYPLTGGYMDISEKGGLWGALLSEIAGKTKKGIEDFGDYIGSGITSALAGDTKEDKEKYISETFGPHREDIEELDLTREYEGPWPHEGMPLLPTPVEAGEPPFGAVDVTPDATMRRDEEPLLVDDEPIRDVDIEPLPFDEGREDYIAELGMNPNLLRQEKLRGMGEIPRNLINPPLSPHGDLYADPGISVEFGDNEVAPPPINYDYDPRTESGIANLMPGGPLYDDMPMGQRLRSIDTAKRLKEGPHRGMPLSYLGRNWYDEYNRKMRNEMEVNRGIRSPMDR